MATEFTTSVVRTVIPNPTNSVDTSVVLSSVMTVIPGSTSVLIEINRDGSAVGTTALVWGGDESKYFTPTASGGRLNSLIWLPIGAGGNINVFTNNSTICKFYIRAFSNAITWIPKVDIAPQVTINRTLIKPTNLPPAAYNGAAVVRMHKPGSTSWGTTIQSGNQAAFVMGGTYVPEASYVEQSCEVVGLNNNGQLWLQSGSGNLNGATVEVVGYFKKGNYNESGTNATFNATTANTAETVNTWTLLGEFALMRTGTGYGVSGWATDNASNTNTSALGLGVLYVKPSGSNTMSWFCASTTQKLQYVGNLASSYTRPDSFTCPTKTKVLKNTNYESNPITVAGATGPITATVTNGEITYSTDGGTTWAAWGTAGVTVSNGNLVKVRVLSSTLHNTTVTALVGLDTTYQTFESTTHLQNTIDVSDWTKNSTSPLWDGSAINGGH